MITKVWLHLVNQRIFSHKFLFIHEYLLVICLLSYSTYQRCCVLILERTENWLLYSKLRVFWKLQLLQFSTQLNPKYFSCQGQADGSNALAIRISLFTLCRREEAFLKHKSPLKHFGFVLHFQRLFVFTRVSLLRFSNVFCYRFSTLKGLKLFCFYFKLEKNFEKCQRVFVHFNEKFVSALKNLWNFLTKRSDFQRNKLPWEYKHGISACAVCSENVSYINRKRATGEMKFLRVFSKFSKALLMVAYVRREFETSKKIVVRVFSMSNMKTSATLLRSWSKIMKL